MGKGASKMPVKYYNYRVEFQLRGAGHIHGCLWLDLEQLSQVLNTENPEDREAMDENADREKNPENDPKMLQKIFDQIKAENVGLDHNDCQGCGICGNRGTWFPGTFFLPGTFCV